VKEYYFISGLPRSGSTLLSAILKQNPEFYGDIKSPIEKIVTIAIDHITYSLNNSTVSEEQRKNLIYGIFDGYYKNINKPVIFDTSRSWTKKTNLLQALFPYTKIICPVRDIASILNSFELISSGNPFFAHTLTKNEKTVFSRCDDLMNMEYGIVAEPLTDLREGYACNPEMIHFIEYDNLCKDPEKTMREVYEFLEKPYYSHDFQNLEYSNETFDKICNLKGLHTVRRKVEYKPPRCILPPEIVQKYQNMEFWRNGNKNIVKKFIDYQ